MEQGRPSIPVDDLMGVEYVNVGEHFNKRSPSVPPQKVTLSYAHPEGYIILSGVNAMVMSNLPRRPRALFDISAG